MAKVEQCFFDHEAAMNTEGGYTSIDVPYLVFELNTDDPEHEALEAVRNFAPVSWHSRVRESIEIDERINDAVMRVRVTYGSVDTDDEQEEEEEPTFSFDTGGGTMHRTQSILTFSRTPANAPDFGGAIEVDNEGNVNGVDVTMPVMYFSETHYFKNSKVTTSYKKRLGELTGTMNGSSFKGYAAGEVLFLGASGTRRGDKRKDLWEISFKFAVSPNQSGLKVGTLTVSKKYGWDYLWVRYADDVAADKKNLIKKPVAAYVERVYRIGDFGGLGIGR